MSKANTDLVDAFYRALMAGNMMKAATYLAPDLIWDVPAALPWGGAGVGADRFMTEILPRVGKAFDFDRFGYDSLTGNDTHVSAFVHAGVVGRQEITRLAEDWTIMDGRLAALRVFYFDPEIVVEAVEAASRRSDSSVAAPEHSVPGVTAPAYQR